MQILPAITTIFDWRSKVKEVGELGLSEVSLFLTCLNFKERQEMYSLLKTTKIQRIPFAHIRTDMTKSELDYLIKNYGTQAFNIHTKREFPYPENCEKYKKMIYIENTYFPLDKEELREFGGICLDLSHLESDRLFRPETYRHNINLIDEFGCGCNHIGPAKKSSSLNKKVEDYPRERHHHTLKKLSELDYLKKYPKKYFGKFASLEMENSIGEQLEAKDYILKLLRLI